MLKNYADDNTLSVSNSIPNLIKMEEETNIAILWHRMIALEISFNYHTKNRKETTGNILNKPWVKLLGVKIDNKLNLYG